MFFKRRKKKEEILKKVAEKKAEYEDYQQAYEKASNSYARIKNEYEAEGEKRKEWEKAYNENLEQERNDNIDYYVKEISRNKADGKGYTTRLDILDTAYWNNPEEFEEKYCVKE